MRPPEVVADDGDWLFRRDGRLLLHEESSLLRRRAENGEEVRADEAADDSLGLVAAREIHALAAHHRERIEAA